MDLNAQSAYLKKHAFPIFVIALGALVVALLIFRTGFSVGARKGLFTCRWGQNYHRNFAGPREGFDLESNGPGFAPDFIESHGAYGQVIGAGTDTLIVKRPDGLEKVVVLGPKTVIKRGRETIGPEEVSIDEYVVIIGAPNEQGQVAASLIRLVPSPSFRPERERRR